MAPGSFKSTEGSGTRAIRRVRRSASLGAVASALLVAGSLFIATPAYAGVGMSVAPTFPTSVTVGATNLSASLSIENESTTPQNDDPVVLTAIGLNPTCGTATEPCTAPDLNVFALDTPAAGRSGTACASTSFAISGPNAAGRFTFTPTPSPVVLGSVATGGLLSTCVIDFTFDALKLPTVDADAGTAGFQTVAVGSVAGESQTEAGALGSADGSQAITVNQVVVTTTSSTTSPTTVPTTTSTTAPGTTTTSTSSTTSTSTTVRPTTTTTVAGTTTTTVARALVRTGSDTAQLAGAGAILLIVGAQFLNASRQRRREWHS